MPTIEDMAPDLTKAKIFTVVDAKDGFWQVELSEKSSHYTTEVIQNLLFVYLIRNKSIKNRILLTQLH